MRRRGVDAKESRVGRARRARAVAALRAGGRARTENDGHVPVDRLKVREQRLRLVAGDAFDVGDMGDHLVLGIVLRDAKRGGRDARVGALCADVRRSDESARHAAGRGSGAQRTLLALVDARRRAREDGAGEESRARAVLLPVVQPALVWQVGILTEPEPLLRTREPRADVAELPRRRFAPAQATQYGRLSVGN